MTLAHDIDQSRLTCMQKISYSTILICRGGNAQHKNNAASTDATSLENSGTFTTSYIFKSSMQLDGKIDGTTHCLLAFWLIDECPNFFQKLCLRV